MNAGFWRGRRVFVTGHTGFKGGWLALWLRELGAQAAGYSLATDTTPSLCAAAGIAKTLEQEIGDIRDAARLRKAIASFRPEVVFHLAAQALVLRARREPVETFETNVIGTANLLQALRECPGVRSVVVVTSDKCYAPGGGRPFVEDDRLGGSEPYSASKAAAEIVTAAMREAYFATGNTLIATARAGNVIGGGDWAEDRLLPDCMRAFKLGEAVKLRYPDARRPWQHVLEPLSGYLLLAERLFGGERMYASSWNFAPAAADQQPVGEVAGKAAAIWGGGARWERADVPAAPETPVLTLDASRARNHLAWRPRLALDAALDWTVSWYRRAHAGEDAAQLCAEQIRRYAAMIPA